MTGFLCINKPKGMTSSQVVSIVKRRLGTSKVGHMGTLDPLASGVLVVATGKATKMFDYFLDKSKEYIATFTFGYETTTLDSEGEIINQDTSTVKIQTLRNSVKNFIKSYDQIPPNFSAKSINGTKAYKLARQGKTVELKPKNVTIYDIKVLQKLTTNTYKVYIKCSSGTYIRSLCRDIALDMGTFGTMTDLVRISSGKFTLENSINIDDINKDTKTNSIDKVFDTLPKITLGKPALRDLLDGKTIKCSMQDTNSLLIMDKNICFGVGTVNNNTLKMKTYLKGEEDD